MLTKIDLSSIGRLLDKKLDTKLRTIKEDIERIRKDQKTIVSFFDREYLQLRKRIEIIEQHLGLQTVQ